MSELQNPLFDEEKEFLERKKLEYERALRGDVDHIKEQSTKVGKIALVGAGLAGSVWLISKIFGGKKRKPKAARYTSDHDRDEHDDESGPGYFTAGNGKRYKSTAPYRKSAADSAQVFADHHEQTHEADDLGFGSKAAQPAAGANSLAANDEDFQDDPFQDLPYDDSRRLPVSHAFDSPAQTKPSVSRTRVLGSLLQAFLQSDTGKVLAGQAAAVTMAMVTKKMGEFFPTAKNSDLAASSEFAAAATEDSPVASSASPVPSDASNPPQSL